MQPPRLSPSTRRMSCFSTRRTISSWPNSDLIRERTTSFRCSFLMNQGRNQRKWVQKEWRPRSPKALTTKRRRLTSLSGSRKTLMEIPRVTNWVCFDLFRAWANHQDRQGLILRERGQNRWKADDSFHCF